MDQGQQPSRQENEFIGILWEETFLENFFTNLDAFEDIFKASF